MFSELIFVYGVCYGDEFQAFLNVIQLDTTSNYVICVQLSASQSSIAQNIMLDSHGVYTVRIFFCPVLS
jgi:hypothetical protein